MADNTTLNAGSGGDVLRTVDNAGIKYPVTLLGTGATTTLVDATHGLPVTSAGAASGSAVSGNPFLVGGQDGTNARTLLVDTSGRQVIVGAAAAAAAVSGNPLYMGGKDASGNVQPVLFSQQAAALSISMALCLPGTLAFTSVATTGVGVKSGAGTGYSAQFLNNTGSSIIMMLFDATTTRSNGTVPLLQSGTVATGAALQVIVGSQCVGLGFTTGIWMQFSSTVVTMTTIASTAITGYLVYL